MVRLLVRSSYGDWATVLFCVDSAADRTSIPIYLAKLVGVGFKRDKRGVASGMVGEAERFRDEITVSIFGELLTWPCDFVAAKKPATIEPYGVLGRAGFWDDFAFCVDKPYLYLRRRGSRFRRLRSLFPPWYPELPADKPL